MKENRWRFGDSPRIPKFADESRRFPKKSRRCLYVYLRVQGPESRVQSPVQSPVLVLDYASWRQQVFCPELLVMAT